MGAQKDENSKKNLFEKTLNGMKKVADIGSDIAGKQRIKNKNHEIDSKIIEHKYNIGKYIYDNELEIDDGIVISTINTIDRLVDEITKLEGNKNG